MNSDRHPAQSIEPSKPHWPEKVKPIGLDGLEYLGVDRDGQLYWDGKLVDVGRRIDLSRWQIAFGVASLVAASIASGSAAISAWADLHDMQACPIQRTTQGR